MTLQTGTREGPASFFDYVGMAAGVLAPLTLTVYVIVAGRVAADDERGYSHLGNMISELGDRSDAIGTWFFVVNTVVGVLLLLFTIAAFRRVPVGRWVIVLLVATSMLSIAIGTTRCQHHCELGSDDINLSAMIPHRVSAFTLLVLISLIPWLVHRDMSPDIERFATLRRMTFWLPQITVITGVATVVAVIWFKDVQGLFQRITWGVGYLLIIVTSVLMFIHRRGSEPRRFDVTNVQENVLYGRSEVRHGVLKFATIESVLRFRSELRTALDDGLVRGETRRPKTSGSRRGARAYTISIAFTRTGLRTLEVPYRWNATGDDPFDIGMQARHLQLGDEKEGSSRDGWRREWRDVESQDLLIWITAEDRQALATAEQEVADSFTSIRFALPAVHTDTLPDGTEHFGFRDGISNPWIEQIHDANDVDRRGGGKLVRPKKRRRRPDERDLEWQPIALGEFILGEVDESRDIFPVPSPRAVFTGGTFLVIRQLRQDVDEFKDMATAISRLIAEDSSDLDRGDPEERAKAMLVGRRPSGAPLGASDSSSGWANNAFRYGDDPEGFSCPVGAHVRRANPRDSLGFDGVPSNRRRIVRRGMPYDEGDDEGDGEGDGDGDEKGLLFAAYNVRIADQFEFIQEHWLNDGDAFRLGRCPDVMGGNWPADDHRSILVTTSNGRPILTAAKRLVETRGGAYLFVPSISGLRALANVAARDRPDGSR